VTDPGAYEVLAGDNPGHSVLATLGPAGTVTIHVTGTTLVIADVSGYSRPSSAHR
jgi:hypothetical protein